jgi:hypothetical protein
MTHKDCIEPRLPVATKATVATDHVKGYWQRLDQFLIGPEIHFPVARPASNPCRESSSAGTVMHIKENPTSIRKTLSCRYLIDNVWCVEYRTLE